ncbi:DNA mismatch repair protein [Alteromonas sp. H39]|uniref:DNA mismatch repair protein n=1 Tax=Alteromonas sp. H39 TaxID=3389876 RepID=UPI0039E16BCC
MTSLSVIYSYSLMASSAFWGVLVIKFWATHEKLPGRHWLLIAGLLWPLLIFDEWIKYTEFTAMVWALGASDFIAPVLMVCCYRAITLLVLEKPTYHRLLWLPVIATALLQSTLIFIPVALRETWFEAAPSGSPVTWWPLYSVNLLVGFSVLFYSILMAERIQHYHRYLGEQVVDTGQYRIRRLSGVAGTCVGAGFASILLVTAATFGFFPVDFWQSLQHMLMALVILLLLAGLTTPRQTSPSPLDYERLEAGAAPEPEMLDALQRAEQLIIDEKLYKKLGLTLKQFCVHARTDPTLLAISLRVLRQKSFRMWVFSYRLEYAKKVLLRTDTSISKVSRRLGIPSDTVLSDALAKYAKQTSAVKNTV